MNTLRSLILLLLVTLGAAPAHAQSEPTPPPPTTATTPAAMLARADDLFDRAALALRDNPTAARGLFAQAAAAYQELVRDHQVRHAAIYTNLGNARLLAGDVGRAVADLRRAERLDPTSDAARRSLEAARARVPAAVAPDTSTRALDILLIWRRILPRSVVMLIGLCAWIAVWTLGAVRIASPDNRPHAAWILIPAAGAALCLGGLLLEEFAVFRRHDAVVIAEDAVGRLGPDAVAFEPSFSAPLAPGVEGTIVAANDDWRMLRLADGRTTWLPALALEEIRVAD